MAETLKFRFHRFWLTKLFGAGAKKKKGRGTHKTGVGGRGTLEILDAGIPAHPLWKAGRRFDVVLRHANLNLDDDLGADYRGAALKIRDGGEHVLDMLMNTGDSTVWCHVSMFAERMWLTLRKKLPEFYVRNPDAVERYWGGLRRAPDNYEELAYYSKLAGGFVGEDGVLRCCKYRLIPAEWGGTDTGLPTERDRDAGITFTERWPEETRPEDTLRSAFKARLSAGPIHYVLQIVVRDHVTGYTDPMYDACKPWDTEAHPWRDLARLELNEVMPDAELEGLRFNIGHTPDSLPVLTAESPTDFTSIGHLRKTLYTSAAKKRP